jgi:DNA replication and repair protein RecF
MEAIYILAIGKSFRASNESEVVNWNAANQHEGTIIDGSAETTDSTLRIIIGYNSFTKDASLFNMKQDALTPATKRHIKINGVSQPISELVGQLNAVLFSAEDIDLVTGSPSVRRRYLDILISQIDKSYLRALSTYQHTLVQRNRLLKLISEGRATKEELPFWNQQLIKEGTSVLRKRVSTVEILKELSRKNHRELTDDSEDLSIKYISSFPIPQDTTQIGNVFSTTLEENYQKDIATGVTGYGPQRDDVRLMVNGADMRKYSSRGQARTIALALRLGEASYMSKIRGEHPILLLDDILSELDPTRRAKVMEKALSTDQSIITTTDLNYIKESTIKKASTFHVNNGNLYQQT